VGVKGSEEGVEREWRGGGEAAERQWRGGDEAVHTAVRQIGMQRRAILDQVPELLRLTLDQPLQFCSLQVPTASLRYAGEPGILPKTKTLDRDPRHLILQKVRFTRSFAPDRWSGSMRALW
jgi:hypothetical protein